MPNTYDIYFIFLLFILLSSCNSMLIIQQPISFGPKRKALSLEYLENRYGIIKEEPSIKPKMIVVHHTVIPTKAQTYSAFFGPVLPGARASIQSASSLNVSSQYVIDRDGVIYQLLPDTVFARHVIGLNHCAIGIENVGDNDELPLTKKQLKVNEQLIKQLAGKHPIQYLIGHHEYKAFIGHPLWKEKDADYLTDKDDPGNEFMEKLRRRLKNLNLKGPPSNEY